MTDFCTLYVTITDKASAATLARTLLDENLVACANISDGMTSIYKWEGSICEEAECAILLKTRKNLAEKTTARIKTLHPYDTPCIIQWDITGGSADYLKWLEENFT